MKSKLFKHMTLPEMYFIDVDKQIKYTLRYKVEKKTEFLSFLFMVVQEDIAEANIIIYLTQRFLGQ